MEYRSKWRGEKGGNENCKRNSSLSLDNELYEVEGRARIWNLLFWQRDLDWAPDLQLEDSGEG